MEKPAKAEQQTTGKKAGEKLAPGQRVKVYWPAERAWFEGRVVRLGSAKGQARAFVVYDDGDEEWVNPGSDRVKVVEQEPGVPAAKRARPTSSRNVVGSDDEDAGASSDDGAGVRDDSDYAASDDEDNDEDDDDSESLEASASENEAMEEDEGEDEPRAKGSRKRPRQSSTAAAQLAATPRRPLTQQQQGGSFVASRVSMGRIPCGPSTPASALRTPASACASLSKDQGTPSVLGTPLWTPHTPSGTPAAATPGSTLKEVLGGAPAERFAERAAQRFPFLRPDRIMDAAGRRPGAPGYDPTTVYIPPSWFREAKISEGQRQWWGFKAANYDAVILFKMGKFYEMFEMDAHIGVEVLGLSYMRGDQPHAGFPEAAYASMAAALARAGHKVVVVEQTETPEALAARNETRRAAGQKKCGVVRREKISVLTPGTLADAEMVGASPDPIWLLAVCELPVGACSSSASGGGLECGDGDQANDNTPRPAQDTVWMGAAAADVAGGRLRVGQWRRDELRGALRALLCELHPAEVLAVGDLSAASRRVLAGLAPGARIVDRPAPGWEAALESLRAQRTRGPAGLLTEPALMPLGRRPAAHAPMLGAVGATLRYLSDALLSDAFVALAAVEPLLVGGGLGGSGGVEGRGLEAANDGMDLGQENGVDTQSTTTALLGASQVTTATTADSNLTPTSVATQPTAVNSTSRQCQPETLEMDAAAVENLEILESADGSPTGSMLRSVDHCVTPGGRSRLRTWLLRPLCDFKAITARQDAVEELMGRCQDAGMAARRNLSGVADAGRAVARLTASGLGLGPGREAPRVVLYEDTARPRVRGVAATLRALRRIEAAVSELRIAQPSAPLLTELVTPGARFPALKAPLQAMWDATDWESAEATGQVVPTPGVDAAFDLAEVAVTEAARAVDDYLEEVRQLVRSRSGVSLVSVGKDTHVLQIQEGLLERAPAPADWEPMPGKKGVRRYISPELRRLAKRVEDAHEQRETAGTGILQAILVKFAEHRRVWQAAIDCASELDALISLAVAASSSAGPMCRPVILPDDDGQGEAARPVFKAVGLRHPVAAVADVAASSGSSAGGFVPNDVELGGEGAAPFLVLTGPNMGGKSMLMRQVCLAVVLAQTGAWVPAESLQLTPVDRLFVRMGARDRLLLGQSTFFVEMAETSVALARATRRSLVALDELGRGTATADGAAIAAAVLDHLARDVGCRGVFATHYHQVALNAEGRLPVAVCHMACRVEGGEDGSGADGAPERVTFLYKVTPGACPASYGINVARLAGLPRDVVRQAGRMAASFAGNETAASGGTEMELRDLLDKCRQGLPTARAAWEQARGRPVLPC